MPEVVLVFTGVVVFAQMYGLGTRQEVGSIRALLSDTSLLFRSLISVLVAMPLATLVIIFLLPVRPEVALGLAILAAAPGAPLTTRRSEAAAADFNYVASLQLLLALLAVVYTPFVLFLFSHLPQVAVTPVSLDTVAAQVGLVTFLPAVLGWASARAVPRLRNRHNKVVAIVSKGLYLLFLAALLAALALLPDLRQSLAIGWTTAFSVVILCAVALASGYTLGGPVRSKRAGLAIATIARNIGLSLYIAEQSELSYPAIPTILLFALIGVCMALPASVVFKRFLGGT